MISWLGSINTADLIKHFGVSRFQASKDINSFKNASNSLITYSLKQKRYIISEEHDGYLHEPKNDEIFQLYNDHTKPDFISKVPKLNRKIKHKVWLEFVDATSNLTQLNISLFSEGEKIEAGITIHPHHLFYANSEWYIRAFTLDTHQYDNYKLSNVVKSKKINKSLDIDFKNNDDVWNLKVIIKFHHHPKLTNSETNTLTNEKIIYRGKGQIETRAAMIKQLLQENRIAIDENVSPLDFKLLVSNYEEIKKYI